MEPRFIAWIAAGLLAVATLVQLMQARQGQLKGVLEAYMQSQLVWSRKRAKAARLAQKMARAKGDEEAGQPPLQDSPQLYQEDPQRQKAA